MSERFRAFVATHLPEELHSEALSCISLLKDELSDFNLKWVKPEQIHLTLAFLGTIDSECLPELSSALDKATCPQRPFRLQLHGMGRFGTTGRGQVLWIGLYGDLNRLSMLSSRVQGACAPFTKREERRTFNPHITIARCSNLPKEQYVRVGEALRRAVVHPRSWTVDSFQLMRSHLKPTGAEYEILQSFILGDG